MSGPSQAIAVTEPEDDGSLLADRLLEQLDTPRSGPLAEFVRMYVRRPPAVLTENLEPAELAAQVRGMFEFVNARTPGVLAVRCYRPRLETDGYETPGTVVDVNVEDAPFLVDTVSAELHTHGLQVRVVVHPVIGIERGADGRIVGVTPARGAERRESVMHFETDRTLNEGAAEDLVVHIERVLGDLQLAVRDFLPMVDRVERMIEVAGQAGGRFTAKEIHESVEFLEWLTDDNFIYLGYREYAITGAGDDAVLEVVPDSGLGIMSDPARSSYATGVPLSAMTPALRERMLGGPLVVISKTNRETTIHRAARMDYIGVRRVAADGSMIGELRMVGLFTSKIVNESARLIPIVRRKLDAITRWEDLFAGSHDHKAVVALFDSFPKDELFTAPAQELRHVIMTLLGMAERREVRLFVLHDEALPQRVRGGRAAARPRLRRPAGTPRAPVGSALRGHLGRAPHSKTRAGSGAVPLHHPRARGRSAGRRSGRRSREQEVGTRPRAAGTIACPTRWSSLRGPEGSPELARRYYTPSFPSTTRAPPRSIRPVFDVDKFELLPGEHRPYVVALQNERHMAEPLTPPEAVQDRRQGAAHRPAAAARTARADRDRGGADPASRRPRRAPLSARLRRARSRRQTPRPGASGRPRDRDVRRGLGRPGRLGLAQPAGCGGRFCRGTR